MEEKRQEENNLIEKAKKGDVRAFEKLISDHLQSIYNLSYQLIGNEADARDLSQEVIIKIFNSIGNFRGDSLFSTWIWRIVHNTFLDEFKKSYKKITSVTDPIDSMPWLAQNDDSPLEEAEKNEFREKFEKALLEVPLKYRLVIIMYNLQGFSYNEIAETVNCSVATVKSRLSYGRNLLRKVLLKAKILF
ncbi:MAG: hypothetical protein A2539_10625 [Elusimicrobia bacterium RIFOXYD2_FULL_34_15]|nr:MAG: hypothetical protein A2539_10625 [Elusimicrobia bacterium RIFOXYD2_FULL_34_15]